MGRTRTAGQSGATGTAAPDGGLVAWLLAWCAILAAVASVVVLLLVWATGGLLIVWAGLLGLVVCVAGVWWFVAHRGLARLLGLVLAVLAPAAVLALFTWEGLWLQALIACLCWGVALTCARAALRRTRTAGSRRTRPAPRPKRPVLIMNPRSGGGKVERFGLVERARTRGAEVILLDPDEPADVAALARRAVEEGAGLLGVAGGDGTQALVAAVAAEHDLPFLVISAGTRNHFAMDLGLDRDDPGNCLDALDDGEEVRVDLGDVAGRAFVNTVSFGVYADVVQRPEYRDDKAGTALSVVPDLLVGEGVRRLDALIDGDEVTDQQALLVSNNPYAAPNDLGETGRRPRLDGGRLGVLGVRVESAAQAADLAVRGAQSTGLTVETARRVEVTCSGAEEIPVAVDGEALRMATPVVCALRPGALRVLVPRDRPGVTAPPAVGSWRRLLALALCGAGATKARPTEGKPRG